MRLRVDLTPELEIRLAREAEVQGVPVERLTLDLLDRHLPIQERQAKVSELLRSWIEGDAQEQRETGAYLIQALDEDRLSDRELFPAELEGKTW